LKNRDKVHPVKEVAKKLGLTYRQLGEAIGYSEGTLRRAVSKNEISTPLKRALELYLENESLKETKEKINRTKELISTLLKEM